MTGTNIYVSIMFALYFIAKAYLLSPVLTHALPRLQHEVYGLAVLFDEVFIVRRKTPELEAYSITATTWTPTRRLPVNDMENPVDMAACRKFSCIYVADCENPEVPGMLKRRFKKWQQKNVVHRIEKEGSAINWMVGDKLTALSVTAEPNYHVIVTCREARKLNEFTTNGVLVREVVLQHDVVNPLHAVTFNGRFIVSHGFSFDDRTRVCIVDCTGRVTAFYDEPRNESVKGRLGCPLHLAVDGDGNIFAVDLNNRRILLMDPTLCEVRELVTKDNVDRPIFFPSRLYLDDLRGRLFVADGGNNDALVLRVKDV